MVHDKRATEYQKCYFSKISYQMPPPWPSPFKIELLFFSLFLLLPTEFYHKSNLRSHQECHHAAAAGPSSSSRFQCLYCSTSFESMSKWSLHLRDSHEDRLPKSLGQQRARSRNPANDDDPTDAEADEEATSGLIRYMCKIY